MTARTFLKGCGADGSLPELAGTGRPTSLRGAIQQLRICPKSGYPGRKVGEGDVNMFLEKQVAENPGYPQANQMKLTLSEQKGCVSEQRYLN